ncbi:hypothetical protein HELRODRAFT_166240 [Helobdella robusta]|uniref:RNA-binding protein 8A n=1 Tax=Helobdella robusta TaxID=6412 RepID=T1EXX7_HELRO|nr:hypothetical protein HELRODRAFT_166240 [Helobdella robusta]ESN90558.1 hypothetical protein HELRODRAFT_166240 [Helobdella robusta]
MSSNNSINNSCADSVDDREMLMSVDVEAKDATKSCSIVIDAYEKEFVDVDGEAEADEGVQKLKEGAKKKRGRGLETKRYVNEYEYESMDVGVEEMNMENGPQRCQSVEGWIVFVKGINEETQEDDIREKFEEFGEIKNLHLNLDRRTGFLKGYALIEYSTYKEAEAAIQSLNGTELCGQKISVDWTFVKQPNKKSSKSRKEQRQNPPPHHRHPFSGCRWSSPNGRQTYRK